MYKLIRDILKNIPILKQVVSEIDDLILDRERLHAELVALKRDMGFVPPGHFYSAIPSLDEVRRCESTIFSKLSSKIHGVELNEAKQLKLLNTFVDYYSELPFNAEKSEGLRYYYENKSYEYSDAILLHCMIRHLKPKKIIEVGSGFSSCVTLDTNELFFDNSINTTFIEPYPELFMSLIKDTDINRIKVMPSRLQDVDFAEFESLQENDILFIDSTHVSKINSDVNVIFFDILPKLSSGVYVHFHDVFFPFEYPKEWIYKGIAWNEAYLLRAFLQYNSAFSVVLMNTYMEHFHESFFQQKMPLCMKNTGGSIWVRKE